MRLSHAGIMQLFETLTLRFVMASAALSKPLSELDRFLRSMKTFPTRKRKVPMGNRYFMEFLITTMVRWGTKSVKATISNVD